MDPFWRIRMTFSTPVTPTRDRPSATLGICDWTSTVVLLDERVEAMCVKGRGSELRGRGCAPAIGEERLAILPRMGRGLPEVEAAKLIVNGFVEQIVRELPMEYAVELNRLIDLHMEGAVG